VKQDSGYAIPAKCCCQMCDTKPSLIALFEVLSNACFNSTWCVYIAAPHKLAVFTVKASL